MEPRKSIFVTGAASGIGRAVAVDFAKKGWFVGLADMDEKGLAETSALIATGQSSSHYLDVRSRDDWTRALATFWQSAQGRMDVLFNNAGVGRGGELAKMPKAEVDLVLDVNIKGVIYGAEAGFDYLAKTHGSCLINTASAAGIYGVGSMSVYCASKFAVRGLTESLDLEWAPYGIRVCSLMPGFIDTPILESISLESNRPTREVVQAAGLEISPVSLVVDAVWALLAGKEVHRRVGKTAHRSWFIARWFPGLFRKRARRLGAPPKS
jgi:NAD(P)-dependent dehydrogenase (short-subunit alcohol dehydrogenase family)